MNQDDDPLYKRDPAAWMAHLSEGNAHQARKRVSADVLILDPEGRLLLVDPRYKPDWDLPGGMAEANEPPQDAAHRELSEELSLDVEIGRMLCVDWVSPHGPWDDLLAFLFYCPATPQHVAAITLGDEELAAFEFCGEDVAKRRLRPHIWRRVSAGLIALRTGQARYLHNGHLL